LLTTPGGRQAAPLQRVEDEDDYRKASCIKSVANQIKSDR